ncbi:hypothetical protein C7H85_05795 [Zobellella endophytica]|uniref:Hom-end-associated Hint domain-containing protein n=1 Tax=Zobellella endophytica TaxID=2116700 RepID=A0A2P7R7H3_9GAMM|nr:Hint domain-containing protein [Zobellella endophytica]PSJ46157.1 hypothetical protein C7H85_05795 [Zobellella endophytica]
MLKKKFIPGRAPVMHVAACSALALLLMAGPPSYDEQSGTLNYPAAAYAKSCFIAGTLVLMADGSTLPIERIRVGQRVWGEHGRINRVIGVERVPLAGRRLYSLNGSTHFVTAEHPFRTPQGWKSLDPRMTAQENARLSVEPLGIGDRLVRGQPRPMPQSQGNLALAPELELVFETQLLEVIESIAGKPGLTVYNLLLDGNHTYIADGFLVHNKGGDGGSSGSGGEGGGSGSSGGSSRGSDDGGGDDNGGRGRGSDDGGGDDNSGRGSDDGDGDDNSGRGRGRGEHAQEVDRMRSDVRTGVEGTPEFRRERIEQRFDEAGNLIRERTDIREGVEGTADFSRERSDLRFNDDGSLLRERTESRSGVEGTADFSRERLDRRFDEDGNLLRERTEVRLGEEDAPDFSRERSDLRFDAEGNLLRERVRMQLGPDDDDGMDDQGRRRGGHGADDFSPSGPALTPEQEMELIQRNWRDDNSGS